MSEAAPGPYVADIGKQSRKRIKRLKDGEGPLLAHVELAVAQARQPGSTREVVPVVILFRRRETRRVRGVSFVGPF